MSDPYFYPQDLFFEISFQADFRGRYVTINSTTTHLPLGQTRDIWLFWKILVQFPAMLPVQTIQCPTRMSFTEGQITHPPGVLKQLWKQVLQNFPPLRINCSACLRPHFKQMHIPRNNYINRQQQKKPTWNQQEQWPVNAAHVLNQRIAKSFCFRPLTDILSRKSNAPPGGPHFGSNSLLHGA